MARRQTDHTPTCRPATPARASIGHLAVSPDTPRDRRVPRPTGASRATASASRRAGDPVSSSVDFSSECTLPRRSRGSGSEHVLVDADCRGSPDRSPALREPRRSAADASASGLTERRASAARPAAWPMAVSSGPSMPPCPRTHVARGAAVAIDRARRRVRVAGDPDAASRATATARRRRSGASSRSVDAQTPASPCRDAASG